MSLNLQKRSVNQKLKYLRENINLNLPFQVLITQKANHPKFLKNHKTLKPVNNQINPKFPNQKRKRRSNSENYLKKIHKLQINQKVQNHNHLMKKMRNKNYIYPILLKFNQKKLFLLIFIS